MSEPPLQPAANPGWNARAVLAALALFWDTAILAVIIADLIIKGWSIAPSPLWSFAITAGAILTVAAVIVDVGARIVAAKEHDTDRIIARIDLLEERSARRYQALGRAAPIEAVITTGEIPRVDPDVMRAASRLQGRVIPLNGGDR